MSDAKLHRAAWGAFLAGAEWNRKHAEVTERYRAQGSPMPECDATHGEAGCAFDVFENWFREFNRTDKE